MNPDNFDKLKNNIEVFGRKNIEVFCNDSTKIINWVSHVIYADPPWGGPQYRTMQNIELWMGKKKLDVWLEDLMSGPYRPKFVFIKVPFNYNCSKLAFLPNFVRMQEIKIYNFFLVWIEVKN
jgi:hypothetical protein